MPKNERNSTKMIEITLIGLVSKNEVYFYVIYDIFQLYVRSLKDHFVKKILLWFQTP